MFDNSRQSDLIPADRLADLSVDVVGVGAIGRNVAIQLIAMGAPTVRLIDFDRVDDSNMASQGYLRDDVGEYKVICLRSHLVRINPDAEINALSVRWENRIRLNAVVLCCVDSMAVRADLHAHASGAQLFVDGRMQAEVGYVFPSTGEARSVSRESYRATLFDDADAAPGRCTAQTTLYGASHVASAMLHQFVRFLRDQPPFACGGMVGAYSKLTDYKV